ncbi:MAG: glycosyltransferase family 4 protein [Gemmatimonadaceae bacterium]
MNVPALLPLSAAATAFVVALVLTPIARYASLKLGMLDIPNERSMHVIPTPRNGGNAILAGILVAALQSGVWRDHGVFILLMAIIALAVLAIGDARFALPIRFRFSAQLLVAGAVVILGRVPIVNLGISPPGITAIPFVIGAAAAIFWLTWMVNAYNFMDGINGLGAVEALVCGSALALLFTASGDTAGATMSLVVAAAAAGFLPWNLPSGSIFMGDVGSTALGLCLAALTLRAAMTMPFLVAFLPLLPFAFDATFTLLKRWHDGEQIHVAHRKHVYQRLARQRGSHTFVAISYGLVATACGAAAIIARQWEWPKTLIPVAAALVLLSGITHVVYYRERLGTAAAP